MPSSAATRLHSQVFRSKQAFRQSTITPTAKIMESRCTAERKDSNKRRVTSLDDIALANETQSPVGKCLTPELLTW